MTVSRIRFEVNRARKFTDKIEKNVSILEQEKLEEPIGHGSPNRRDRADRAGGGSPIRNRAPGASPVRTLGGSPKKSFIEQKIDQDAMDPAYGSSSPSSEFPS